MCVNVQTSATQVNSFLRFFLRGYAKGPPASMPGALAAPPHHKGARSTVALREGHHVVPD